ncbi:MAG: sugar isomerase domain-containing protein [Streptosporangiales bacterium]|nr:sugar isomerase domain-containing protein [Streptosporangiales bacterium]MBO0892256.1 sugar isomerase domain-containing protein [Acidothermales bacterium]
MTADAGQQLVVDQDTAVRTLSAAVDRLVSTQRGAVSAAARLCADALMADGILQAFGTGHSQSFAMEIAGRAGGFAASNRLALRQLVMAGVATPAEIVNPDAERDVEFARKLWGLHDIRPADVFLIASNSGGNATTVEMAILAHDHGNPVVAVTSLDHSKAITSTHPSGKRLFEVADVVVDNCGVVGDSEVELPGGVTVTPTSTVTSAYAAQMIATETCGLLLAAGRDVPVLTSVNVPEGKARNEQLKARYGDRVMENDP